jgi:hypothetical protein
MQTKAPPPQAAPHESPPSNCLPPNCFRSQVLRRGSVRGLYIGKWRTEAEFDRLPTSASSYHRYVYEFKGVPPPPPVAAPPHRRLSSLRFSKKKSVPPAPVAPFLVDATEGGNATREINHYEDLRAAGSSSGNAGDSDGDSSESEGGGGSSTANALFIEVYDYRRNLPCIIVIATRDIPKDEEITLDYNAATYFEKMENMEEIEELKRAAELQEERIQKLELQLLVKDQENAVLQQRIQAALQGKEEGEKR